MRKHVLEVLLAHETEVDPLEEGLSGGINLNGLLQLLELVPGLQNNVVRCIYQILLLVELGKHLIVLLL